MLRSGILIPSGANNEKIRCEREREKRKDIERNCRERSKRKSVSLRIRENDCRVYAMMCWKTDHHSRLREFLMLDDASVPDSPGKKDKGPTVWPHQTPRGRRWACAAVSSCIIVHKRLCTICAASQLPEAHVGFRHQMISHKVYGCM